MRSQESDFFKKKRTSNLTAQRFINSKKLTNIKQSQNITIHESNTSNIVNGMKVKHTQFGEGKVITISGEGNNKKATVFFNGIGQKQLLLKFARLEILSQ